MSEQAQRAEALETVEDFTERLSTTFDTCYTWSYDSFKVGLRNLYEKAKQNQWDSAKALAWDTDVDPEAENLPEFLEPFPDVTIGLADGLSILKREAHPSDFCLVDDRATGQLGCDRKPHLFGQRDHLFLGLADAA